MKAIFIGLLFAPALMAQDASSQQQPPQGDGPSLEDTMKFIQDKLPGRVNYVVYVHDNLVGTDWALKRSFELTNVYADANRCFIGFHLRFDNGKNSVVDKGSEVYLKQAQEIVLKLMDQVLQEVDAKSGHPERSVKIDPPIFSVVVKTQGNHSMNFNFYDEAMSERVSRALQHAVDLCGGGRTEPF